MSYSTLISANQLNQIISDPSLRLFDCRFNLMKPYLGFEQFKSGHIPNSQYADLNKQLAGPLTSTTGRHPLPDKTIFQNQLQHWGIDKDSQIVVYDDAGGAIAARLWWMCKWAGIENAALLDGGIQAWTEAGHKLTQDEIKATKTDFVASYDDNLWISTEQIEHLISKSSTHLFDARANIRYRGEKEPIDPIAGHVPTAKNIPFDNNLNSKGNFLKPDQLLNLHQGNDNIGQVISMCGSGVTACHNMLARKHAGLNMGKLYVGSWSEWITDHRRPIETELSD